MRSGKTANYELDQWTKSDQILMEDFNADNAKIDEALRAVAESNPYRKIISIVTQSDAQQIDLDASGIDFAQYHKIELFVDSPGMTSGYILRVNGISASSSTSTTQTRAAAPAGHPTIPFWQASTGTEPARCCFILRQ